MSRILTISAICLATLAIAATGLYFTTTSQTRFDNPAFVSAQQDDRPILVHVTATWCGTCQQQLRIVAGLANRPDYRDFEIFQIDFDSQREASQHFNALQSTMIVYRGQREIGRIFAEANPTSIETLLRRAL